MRAASKKYIRLISAAMTVLLLSGCIGGEERAPEMELSQTLPQRAEDGEERGEFTARLYFLSDDGLNLSVEERELVYGKNTGRAEAAVEALIDGPVSTVLNESVPGDVSLQRVEVSSDACNVYLLASYTPDARRWIIARAAIAATVFACEDVPAVNLYLNGMEPGYYGRALGAMYPITNMLDTYIVELQQEFKEISEAEGSGNGVYETRTATMYFTDTSHTLLIAKNVTLNYDSSETNESVATLLINRLLNGSEGESVLPEDFTLHTPIIITKEESFTEGEEPSEESDTPHPTETLPGDTEGEDPGIAQDEPQIIDIIIEQPQTEYDEDIMCGALTMTLTGYIPNVQGVAISVCDSAGRITSLCENDYFTREDFANSLGRMVNIAYPDEKGGLMYRVPKAMTSRDSYDPRSVLEALFEGPAVPGVLYPGFTRKDILDVYITGNTAVVNWKAGFGEKLKAYIASEDGVGIPNDKRERMFIYSVVNTLTEIQGISAVWMLEDGQKLGKIGEMYLGNALMRNPGIIIGE